MQACRSAAVWLLAGLIAACGDPEDVASASDPCDRPAGAAASARRAASRQAYVKASNTCAGDYFGYSVAMSADGATLAVGAPREDSAATGVGGDQDDHSAADAGAVYVFARAGATWIQQAYVKASNTDAGDFFGHALALSADGATLAVGTAFEASAATGVGGDQADDSAASAGAVYVFARSGQAWAQQAYVKAGNTGAGDRFGHALALSADGSTLAVGAWHEDSAATGVGGDQADDSIEGAGAVYVLTRRGAAWRHEAYLKPSRTGRVHELGYSVALSADGATLAAGARYETAEAGAVYVFARSGETWIEEAHLAGSHTEAGDRLGSSVALSADGSLLAVGAHGEDSAATGVDGDPADNSAGGAGAVYTFARRGAAWRQEAYLKASNTDEPGYLFGAAIALAPGGDALAVGAYLEPSAATGLDGDQANRAAPAAGAVYLFTRGGATWRHEAYLKASNTGARDLFGGSVALAAGGAILAVGAHGEDSAATGVDGDQADDSASKAGAIYVLDRRP